MRTIETTAVVTADHTMTIQMPADVPPGTHQIVVVVEDDKKPAPGRRFRWAEWPAHNVTLTDPNCTFRREDLYGDDGR
jgi:hypothetical protein